LRPVMRKLRYLRDQIKEKASKPESCQSGIANRHKGSGGLERRDGGCRIGTELEVVLKLARFEHIHDLRRNLAQLQSATALGQAAANLDQPRDQDAVKTRQRPETKDELAGAVVRDERLDLLRPRTHRWVIRTRFAEGDGVDVAVRLHVNVSK